MNEKQQAKLYRIELASDRVEKQLDRLPRRDFERISTAIEQLASNPRPRRGEKLKDRIHRIRVGAYRIIYSIYDSERLVIVAKVDRRKERTYKRLS